MVQLIVMNESTKRRPGPVAGVTTTRTSVLLEPDLLEWGKNQTGGLSETVRRLMHEARDRQTNPLTSIFEPEEEMLLNLLSDKLQISPILVLKFALREVAARERVEITLPNLLARLEQDALDDYRRKNNPG